MKDSYSLYEAKARLSALIRQVREGRRLVITLHGTPVAELRPIEPKASGIHGRIAELEARGALTRAPHPHGAIAPGRKRLGALKRFLASRD